MENLNKNILLELQEVLRVKNFSSDTKSRIRNVLMIILEMNIENKETHLRSIIEGLKKIEIFKINTRKQLMKNKSIKKHLPLDTHGFVIASSQLAVVVKGYQDQASTYHELVHISQNENSYYINNKYDFSGLCRKAMLEGEAIYYELQFQKKQFPMTFGSSFFLSYQPLLYKVCLEFYREMRSILGSELLEKWKNIDSDEKDIMLEFNQYVKDKYEKDFSVIYNCWSGILYYFSLSYDDDVFNYIAKQDLKIMENRYNFKLDYYSTLNSMVDKTTECLKDLKKQLNELNELLEDSSMLIKEYNVIIKEQRKELTDYIVENGMDDVAEEWQDELDGVTIDEYKNHLLNKKSDILIDINREQVELDNYLKEKMSISWNIKIHSLITSLDILNLCLIKDEELIKIDPSLFEQPSILSAYIVQLYIPNEINIDNNKSKK